MMRDFDLVAAVNGEKVVLSNGKECYPVTIDVKVGGFDPIVVIGEIGTYRACVNGKVNHEFSLKMAPREVKRWGIYEADEETLVRGIYDLKADANIAARSLGDLAQVIEFTITE